MLAIVDNHAYIEELMEDILSNPELLNGMHVDTLSQLTTYAIQHDDFRVLSLITELYTGIPSSDNYLPDWWVSDFYDDITQLKFEGQKSVKEIRWCDVVLDDGLSLTDKKHQPLLNAFKYWIVASDNPIENGGKLISHLSARKKIDKIMTLINAILLDSEALKLSKFHLQKVSGEFWLDKLLTISSHDGSVTHSLYKTNLRIKELLDNVEVSQKDIDAFVSKYPHVTREVPSDEIVLNLNDRVKACCWLHQQRYYARSEGDKLCHLMPQGNNAILTSILFDGKCLSKYIPTKPFTELELSAPVIGTEFKATPNQEKGNGTSKDVLSMWLSVIKLINTNIDKDDSCVTPPVSSDVSVNSVQQIATTTLRKPGRTKTLPPEFVFKLFRCSYELLNKFCPAPNSNGANFWDNLLELLVERESKSQKKHSNLHRPRTRSEDFDETLHRHLPSTELGHWLEYEAMDLVHPDFRAKGVQQFESIELSEENRHKRIRNNESVLELFTVLRGAVQLLLGSIMARRQDELSTLKPFGNLVFINRDGDAVTDADPYKEDAECWSLQFKVKKTGVRGKNLTESRPIPLCIARFVWQLERFNQKAIKLGLAKKSDLTFFNRIVLTTISIKKDSKSNQFNNTFDALCDYFETAIVEMDNGEYCRHYVRQHQLRRFFALVFFWSKGYENMDALRYMLAHSDLEHYITENIDGAVINSAKASVITRSVTGRKSMINNADELEVLRKVIAKRLTGDSSKRLSISTLDEATFDYEDESEHKTFPHISQLQAEQELENEVLTLLEDGTVTLRTEWFEIADENGQVVKNFNLVLKVNELELEE